MFSFFKTFNHVTNFFFSSSSYAINWIFSQGTAMAPTFNWTKFNAGGQAAYPPCTIPGTMATYYIGYIICGIFAPYVRRKKNILFFFFFLFTDNKDFFFVSFFSFSFSFFSVFFFSSTLTQSVTLLIFLLEIEQLETKRN